MQQYIASQQCSSGKNSHPSNNMQTKLVKLYIKDHSRDESAKAHFLGVFPIQQQQEPGQQWDFSGLNAVSLHSYNTVVFCYYDV